MTGDSIGRGAGFGSEELALRCLARPVSLATLFFVVDGLEALDFVFTSATGVPASGAGAMVSSALLRVFFEGLLDCMHVIKSQLNNFVSKCFK
jgi:hypothetical protein